MSMKHHRSHSNPHFEGQSFQHATPQVQAMTTDPYIRGTAADEWIYGTNGAETIEGLGGFDQLFGLGGNDQLFGGDGGDKLYCDVGDDTAYGGMSNDAMWGGPGNDVLFGEPGNDHLLGEDGNDTLWGGTGKDTLNGGIGADVMLGGYGWADTFAFINPNEVGIEPGTRDVIVDFEDGIDKISLAGMDADSIHSGNNVFRFGDTGLHDGKPGSVRVVVYEGNTFVMADRDGDKVSDFSIQLDGVHVLTASDFFL